MRVEMIYTYNPTRMQTKSFPPQGEEVYLKITFVLSRCPMKWATLR